MNKTNTSPVIDIIVPAYNVEKYIRHCFNSLKNQTYQNWRCLCMNDGSTDNTLSIMQEYAESDNRFIIFSQKNSGLTKTLNKLLDKVSAPYIFFLDSDDCIHPQTLEILMHALTKHQVDVAECYAKRIDMNATNEIFSETLSEDMLSYTMIDDMSIFFNHKTSIGPWINKWNKLYKWDAVKHIRFSERLTHEDDYFYGSQVCAHIHNKVLVEAHLYGYRVNPTSLCNSLNFRRYQDSCIARIELSYNTFLKTNRVPDKYIEAYKNDLANDCYRMIVRKSLKKCPDKHLRKQLFLECSSALNCFIKKGVIEPHRLSTLKRLCVWGCCHRLYTLCRFIVFIA